ncbi:23S rRNA (guanosine(2251)-2'-O)-methyltransferase RlmB [Wohlfahrtiimonas chitiniclastica]|uniref:23S rRNA (guanosine(2251)-2'-O)-methyltransferase RlmB n=1 Tax=Wohlfahrtiimonas chitiniclastica TaxID=400946 RepID=UPI000B98F693|nr:23S rRNA (guanosine(2251)-2'-O)-methyltransferase RlmB [Wohlfahrtiimonas chitiniclastica]OYQ77258.1 23S rRNA (guanosine(2251)-2'-O)-methyltransferase RlmB [Wohlfahrtiimonas chitiniclastica]
MSNATMWIHGFHAVEAAFDEGSVVQVWLNDQRLDKRAQAFLNRIQDKKIPVNMVNQKMLETKVGEARHQGIAAEVRVQSAKNENHLHDLLEANSAPFLLILDGVTDPHNVGACLRSAEAFGVDAVIVPKDRACGLTPIVRKISSGSSERVPFIEVTNLARIIDDLKERGVWLAGLAGEATETIYQANLTGALAIIMGSEGEGMRRLTREACDFLLKIPMEGRIESLNVSVATGAVLSESHRQRITKRK